MTRNHVKLTISLTRRYVSVLDAAADEYDMSRSELLRRIIDAWAGSGPASHGGGGSEAGNKWGELLEPSDDEVNSEEDLTESAFEEPEKDDDYDLGVDGGDESDARPEDNPDEDEFEIPDEEPF